MSSTVEEVAHDTAAAAEPTVAAAAYPDAGEEVKDVNEKEDKVEEKEEKEPSNAVDSKAADGAAEDTEQIPKDIIKEEENALKEDEPSPVAGAESSEATTDSSSSAPQAKPVRMRYLVDVEREENEKIREQLYPEPPKTEAENYFDLTDLLQRAREDKKEMLDAISKPAGEKAKDFRQFAARLAEPQNRDVAQGFVVASAAMMSVPLVVLMFGIKVVGPYFNLDGGLCGGLMAVASTIVILVLYAMRALREEGVIGSNPKAYANASASQSTTTSQSTATAKKQQ